jgi:transglutaminase-like putative cysteine protease
VKGRAAMKNRFCVTLVCVVLLAARLPAQEKPIAEKPVTVTLRFHVQPVQGEPTVKFTCLVPKTLPDRQRVVSQKFSHEASEIIDENGARYAVFELNVAKPVLLELEFEVVLTRWDLATAQAKPRVDKDQEGMKRWLKAEKYLESEANEILELADTLRGDNDVEMLRSAVAAVTRTLKRGAWDPTDRGASWAVLNKSGDCTEFTDLLVALCRAKGIPAKAVEGYLTTPTSKGDTPKHSRAEVYLENIGWVPVDPFQIQAKSASVDRLPPRYVTLSPLRNDARLSNHHFYAFTSRGGRIKVDDEFRLVK